MIHYKIKTHIAVININTTAHQTLTDIACDAW